MTEFYLPALPVRDLNDTTLFSDITASTWTWSEDAGAYLLRFDLTLTADEQRRVIWRATLTVAQEDQMIQAQQGLSALQNIVNTTGALSTTQLSNQNRTLAKVCIALIHNVLGDV